MTTYDVGIVTKQTPNQVSIRTFRRLPKSGAIALAQKLWDKWIASCQDTNDDNFDFLYYAVVPTSSIVNRDHAPLEAIEFRTVPIKSAAWQEV